MLVLVFVTVLLLATKATAQGTTIALLQNNATTGRQTTLILETTRPLGTLQGNWFRNSQLLQASNRIIFGVVGTTHRLTITNVQDSDAGFYFYVAGNTFTQGYVTVVPNAINGGFSAWGPWIPTGGCSVSCGGGTIQVTRSRVCDNPLPQFGGLNCSDVFVERNNQPCNTDACPVAGTVSRQDLSSNATISVGQTIILQVRMTLNRNRGSWFHNNSVIADSPRTRYSVFGLVHQLSISNVSFADAGQYYYVATGSFTQGFLTVVAGPVVQGLCTNAVRMNGVGYRYHPTDCDRYIQCYYNPGGVLKAVGIYRHCDFGFYWNQVTYRCEEHWNVRSCPVEKCNGTCGLSFKISGSCGAYWQCGETGPEARVCPQGLTFFQGRGCQRNPDCEDVCPSPYISRETCNKRMIWNNVTSYEIYAGDLGWRQMSCPSRTYFDIGDCGCKTMEDGTCRAGMSHQFSNSTLPALVTTSNVNIDGGMAVFNDQSSMTIDVSGMPTTCPKVIQFRYREDSSSATWRVLASTTDSRNANSIVVSHKDDMLHLTLKAWTNNVDMMTLSTAGMGRSEWKTVTLYYDSRRLEVIVNTESLKNRARILAPGLIMMENKILIGTDGTNVRDKHFVGSIDSVSLYNCDAGFLY